MTIEELAERLPEPRRTIQIDAAVAIVAQRYGITPSVIMSKSKCQSSVAPRQEVFWLARQAGLPWQQIANYFGMDHSTIIHGVKAVDERIKREKKE